jgi:hypothetical protein
MDDDLIGAASKGGEIMKTQNVAAQALPAHAFIISSCGERRPLSVPSRAYGSILYRLQSLVQAMAGHRETPELQSQTTERPLRLLT